MSSFIVNPKTIGRIVWYTAYGAYPGESEPHRWAYYYFDGAVDMAALAQDLFELNCAAVYARYGDRAQIPATLDLDAVLATPMPTPAEAYVALSCWLYQCSEGDVPQDELFLKYENLCDQLAQAFVRSLPDYERVAVECWQ